MGLRFKFHQNRSIFGRVVTFLKNSKWRRRYIEFGFFIRKAFMRKEMCFSTTSENFIEIGQQMAELQLFLLISDLAGKSLTTPRFGRFFGGYEPLNGKPCRTDPQEAHSCSKTRCLSN